ncbi:MAG: hypothetical protein LVR00_01900 [Rhabdochlamydiaceae bacterium]|jgi:hypothetical protein
MDNKDLYRKIAALESQLDMAESELSYVNGLLVKCGFEEGTEGLKSTLHEILDETSSL